LILCILKRYILFRSLVGLALLAVLVCYQSVDARERSQEAKDSFKYSHPCPSNGNNHGPCPGYVIDHIKPLTCDGADDPSNMQWQTKAEGKAKDKWERKGCKTDSSGSHLYSESSSSGSGSYQTGPKGGCFTSAILIMTANRLKWQTDSP